MEKSSSIPIHTMPWWFVGQFKFAAQLFTIVSFGLDVRHRFPRKWPIPGTSPAVGDRNLLHRTNCALLVLSSKFLVDVCLLDSRNIVIRFHSGLWQFGNCRLTNCISRQGTALQYFVFCAFYSTINIETYCLLWLWKISTMLVVTKLRLMNL